MIRGHTKASGTPWKREVSIPNYRVYTGTTVVPSVGEAIAILSTMWMGVAKRTMNVTSLAVTLLVVVTGSS